MSSNKMDCPECGAAMLFNDEKTILVCPYCGNTEPLDEVTAERLNKQDDKEVELERIKLERENAELLSQERREDAERRFKLEKSDARRKRSAERSRKLAKVVSTIGVVLVALCVFCFIIETVDDMQYDQERKNKLNQVYEWPTTGLALLVDKPSSENGYIDYNSVTDFEITVKCQNANEFNEYLQSVIARGFTVDAESTSSRYEAYDAQGNHVDIYFFQSSEEMSIEVDAAVARNAIVWPTSGVGAKLPVPSSLVGKVDGQSLDSYRVSVCDIDINAFNAYCDECAEAGFNVEPSRSSTYYYAKSSSGETLHIEYIGFSTICISAYN